jgi:molecular chaperone DnaK (HSP70)
LGGGSLDVSVLKIKGDKVRVLSKDGDSNLGGEGFNQILTDYFIGRYFKKTKRNVS